MTRRRRSARRARWFAAYSVVLLALALPALARGQISLGLGLLLAAAAFVAITWHAWRSWRSSVRAARG